jgi:hypothetical protein
VRPVKLPRPTEHWPHCIGIATDEPCDAEIHPNREPKPYEVGPTMGKMHYRCRACEEKRINRETRNTVYATAEKETAE